MKEKILQAYKKWRDEDESRPTHTINAEDKRVAVIASLYSESELRHALAMRAAYQRSLK